ncbi:MFS transporter [Paenochrobactrum pullorum]|uniref:MFS transporter n=1 Tax=Paenochrobactrum pullorum TaxID=1324351 RepID=UPI0035BC52F2
MNTNKTYVSQSLILLIGILLIATTLRAPITGIAPVLEMIRDDFSFSTSTAGALTTLPLLAFAVVSPFAVVLARKLGLEFSLLIALMLITGGIALRMIETVWYLFLGTAIIGTGIAIANVLLPSLLKRDFPTKIASITGAYSVTAGVAAALASAAAIPIANHFNGGWNWALGAFIIFPVAAIAVWLTQLSGNSDKTQKTISLHTDKPIWKSALAWQVTFFFGLNSLVYYVIVTWLPAMLIEAGFSPAVAGSFHGISQLATAIPGLVFGLVLARFRDQKAIAIMLPLMTAVSLIGILILPQWASLWSALFGFGCGATFILALAFISLRSSNPAQAAALSGMAQCIGYTVAAGAPPAAGFIFEYAGGWSVPLIICTILCVVMAILGYRAGRPVHIE